MNQKILHKVFVWGFLFLYLLVAGISFCHAIEFFNIGNPVVMSAILAFAFELGLSLSLAAILLSNDNKNKALPWILMIILTFVQVVGNVYSTFKYIAMSDVDYYVYLQKPLLFWIEEVSQDTVQVIISWIIGAILPIVALFMTDMVASNLKNMNNNKNEKEIIPDKIEEELPIKEEIIEDIKEEPIIQEKPIIEEPIVKEEKKEIPKKEEKEIKKENTDTAIKNVVVHEEPIKTAIEQKQPTMKINKNVEDTSTNNIKEDEVVNRDKKAKSPFHRADEPYFDLPTIKKREE